MKKFSLIVLLSMFLVACTSNASSPPPISGNVVADTSASQTKEFTLTAQDWDFSPSTLTVNEGDHVIIHAKSMDVEHSFTLPDFGVNQKLEPGKEVTIEFTADKKGEFRFYCAVFCGKGHKDMKGTLTVQ